MVRVSQKSSPWPPSFQDVAARAVVALRTRPMARSQPGVKRSENMLECREKRARLATSSSRAMPRMMVSS